MARQLTIYNNFIAGSGYVLLKDPATLDGQVYSKVWSPIWDIVINKGCEDLPQEDKKEKKNWTWYAVVKNKIYFHVRGDRVEHYYETGPEKPYTKDIYIVGPKMKPTRKRNVKSKV